MIKKIKLVLLVVLLIGYSLIFNADSASAYTEAEKLVLQSWQLVDKSYLDDSFNNQNWWAVKKKYLNKPLATNEEAYKVIQEMLGTLGDPYTRFLPPQKYQNLQITTSGELSGIGLQISINPETNHLEVITPLPSSPAELAGIKPRDQVISIDGITADSLTLDEAANKIRGEIGSIVNLQIKPYDSEQIKEYKLQRDRLVLSSVTSSLDKTFAEYPIGYLRLNQFSGSSAKDIGHGINELYQQGAQAYILDLRNNPGGLLQAGVDIARFWLTEDTIVYTVNRQGIFGSYDANNNALTDAPLVVLVNGGSASASEILAGALQDNDRAILIGEKTFGKGLIQSLFQLQGGSGIAITVAKYETPDHHDINKKGIIPDRIVDQEAISYFDIRTEKDKLIRRSRH